MDLNVSVIVPAYNRADLIGETLRSILAQSHTPAEVIVVDDGSTDRTEAVVREFGSAVRYVRIENSGECRARNVGVAMASSPWVAFCDSDDLWTADKLGRQVRIVESSPDVEYCFTNFCTVVDGQWSKATKFDSSPAGYWDLPKRVIEQDLWVVECPMFESLLAHQPIFPSTVMMKRGFFESVGRWNESLGRTPSVDLEFHLRCVGQPRIGIVCSPVVGIRKHSSNFSGNAFLTTVGEVAILRYVLQHNPVAREYVQSIEEQIVIRSASAAAGAYAIGDFAKMRELLAAVPYQRRSWKLHAKNLIAQWQQAFGGNGRTPEAGVDSSRLGGVVRVEKERARL